MKVLVATIIPPHLQASGAVTASKFLSRALAEHCNIDIAVMSTRTASCTFGKAHLFERKASNILACTQGWLPNKYRTLLYRSDIPAMLRRGGYDMVHIHNPMPTWEMRRIARACVRQGIPYVVSTHGFVEVTSGGQAYALKHVHEKVAWELAVERPLRYVVSHARLIFALSPMEIPLLLGLDIDGDTIRVVTNGVNPAFYAHRTDEQIAETCNRYGLPQPKHPDVPVCIYLGNHTQNKGIELLLEAFMNTSKPFWLIVCGKRRDTINYDAYAQRCQHNQTMLFTDLLPDDDVVTLFRYADLFVYPTLSDTLPLVVLEAMASGLPVLSTRIGGIPFQVDAASGFLIPPGNPSLLRDAFEEMTSDKERLRQMGAAAKLAVREKFDWARSAATAFSYYQEILRDVR